jgi:TP53 regulating kinase-like protein
MEKLAKPRLIKKGAEASLFIADWHGRKVIMKKRLPKKYRPPLLDERIRTYRTIHEPQLLHEAKKAGVSAPLVYLVDVRNATIIMEFIDGRQIKQLLGEVSEAERKRFCLKIGESISKLHKNGIVHGDLTTSNMIMIDSGEIFFVDFGLGEKTYETEAKAVDLHLAKRALQSVHFRFAKECFDAVIEGYSRVLGAESVGSVLVKVREIERRGRYVTERKAEEV